MKLIFLDHSLLINYNYASQDTNAGQTMMKISKDHLTMTLVHPHILLRMPLGNMIPQVIGNWILLNILLCFMSFEILA